MATHQYWRAMIAVATILPAIVIAFIAIGFLPQGNFGVAMLSLTAIGALLLWLTRKNDYHNGHTKEIGALVRGGIMIAVAFLHLTLGNVEPVIRFSSMLVVLMQGVGACAQALRHLRNPPDFAIC